MPKTEKKKIVPISVRLELDVYKKLLTIAEKNTRSVNGQINAMIKEVKE